MGIKQLPKPQTGNPALDRVLNEHVDKLNPILRALPPAAGGQFTQGSWNPITAFLNGWVNLAGFSPAGYMKDTNGRVWLRGMLFNPAGQAPNLPAFVLPVGFRPPATVTVPNVADVGYSRVNLLSNGEVWPSVNITVAVNGFRGIDGISFDTRV